jgi:hypothetical protein
MDASTAYDHQAMFGKYCCDCIDEISVIIKSKKIVADHGYFAHDFFATSLL